MGLTNCPRTRARRYTLQVGSHGFTFTCSPMLLSPPPVAGWQEIGKIKNKWDGGVTLALLGLAWFGFRANSISVEKQLRWQKTSAASSIGDRRMDGLMGTLTEILSTHDNSLPFFRYTTCTCAIPLLRWRRVHSLTSHSDTMFSRFACRNLS